MEKEGNEKGKKECEKEQIIYRKNWMRRKIDDLGVISSEMILLKRNVIKKYF